MAEHHDMDMARDEDKLWAAVVARDRAADGSFVFAVRSTGIYCRPSCPARRPARARVSFLADGAVARAAGYRPCLRCRPDEAPRDLAGVEAVRELIEASEALIPLAVLARVAGYAPHHLLRLFRRETGLTPAAYGRALRAGRLRRALGEEASVTGAIYAAGYGSSARAYAEASAHLGMSPAVWKRGGAGEVIRFACVGSSLGPVLVATTARGICRIAFDEGEADLRARFPRAEIIGDARALAQQVELLRAIIDGRAAAGAVLPLDLRGTAFQRAVWEALRAIPPGETRSYAQVAAAIGRPGAARATGSACAANPVGVMIPCHRVVREDGAPGGYAWGRERKRALLDREGASGYDVGKKGNRSS